MIELAEAEPADQQAKHEQELERDLARFSKELDALELKVLLNGPHDKNNCILSINAGAGGTEARDWAEMLLRMYHALGRSRAAGKWKSTDALPGEAAGIKSVTMLLQGENAYGFCKAERGVHRLVRISPFDSNKRRHTSFASVDAIAEMEEASVGNRDSADGIQRGHVSLRRQRRAEREQGRDRRAHHAHPDRPGRRVARASVRSIRTAPRR